MTEPAANTDRELYREDTGDPAGSYYENSLHVTASGSIGMNVGGSVIVQPIAVWHAQAAPRTAPAAERPCQLRGYHSPKPLRTQYHHSKPVYLQNRVYGRIVYPADLWVCGTDHDSLHTVIDWLLGEGREPTVEPGRLVLAQARRTVEWYRSVTELDPEGGRYGDPGDNGAS